MPKAGPGSPRWEAVSHGVIRRGGGAAWILTRLPVSVENKGGYLLFIRLQQRDAVNMLLVTSGGA